MRPGFLLLLCLLLHVACGGDDDGGVGGADGGGNPECETSEGAAASGVVKIGGVASTGGSRASVDGILVAGTDWQFFDLAPQRQVESARAGDCVLYEWEPTFCEEECAGTICHDGECKPAPELLSAGTLRIVAGGQLIEVNAGSPTFWGPVYRQEILAAPMSGVEVAFCAGGDAAGGFGAILEAVPPLLGALPEDGILELTDGGDVVISWDAASSARVRLTLNADNEAHGLPYRAIIECDAEDSGQLVIPQELVEAFPAVPRPSEPVVCAGSDCPRSQLIRYRAHQVDEPDLRVEVRVESAVEFWVEH
ncbi:MAG TPA: hypothetical protein VFU21_14645 [Kofleriaceae bacterium]|nr:hypothetical protein [Kofleriaceae bacterium]